MSLLPPPNLRKCGVFFRRDDYWVGSAMVEAERLRDYHGLGVTSTILDVGCGVGRLLTGLVETKLLFLRYVGVDVDAAAIDWCSANLAGKHAKFVRLDIHNARYNPSGKIKMNETFMLPFETPFSIIYAWSLFTHLQLSDARAYLREFRRLLAPKGTVFLRAGRAGRTGEPAALSAALRVIESRSTASPTVQSTSVRQSDPRCRT